MSVQRIGLLTSGGDCAGLNAAIKGAALTAEAGGIELYMVTNGYAGLYNLLDFPHLVKMDERRLLYDVHIYMAGSEAGNSRVKISAIKDPNKYERIKAGMAKWKLDALVIAGGDDTGSVVVDLAAQGINCVHIPKTMDLDLMPYSVGGDSTINRIAEFVRDLRTTGRTHNRIIAMEVFGRYAGHTAFRGGIAAQADAILIPEIPVDFDVLYRHVKDLYVKRLEESDTNTANVAIVVAEGLRDSSGKELVDESSAPDAFGHRRLMGAGRYVVQQLEARIKNDPDIAALLKRNGIFVDGLYEIPEVREVRPGHLVRAGYSTAYDANFGMEAGAAAVNLVRQGVFGVTVVSFQDGVVQYMDCKDAIVQRFVNPAAIAMYESMGISFGRVPQPHTPELRKVTGIPTRIY